MGSNFLEQIRSHEIYWKKNLSIVQIQSWDLYYNLKRKAVESWEIKRKRKELVKKERIKERR